jgi:multidrug efflux pump subunit AcrA (membrane-fusion protein)
LIIQRAQVAHAQAIAIQAEKTYGINQRLLALKSIGQLELDVSAAEVQKSKADLASANAVASKCAIDAPFNGVTVEQKAREFQYASPGQPLLDILDDRSLEVELIAPSRWLSWLQSGYPFALHVDETGNNYPAKDHAHRRQGRSGKPIDQGGRRDHQRRARTHRRHERARNHCPSPLIARGLYVALAWQRTAREPREAKAVTFGLAPDFACPSPACPFSGCLFPGCQFPGLPPNACRAIARR